MTPEQVAVTNYSGNTALHFATYTGVVNVAKALLRKNPGLPEVQGSQDFIPLLAAVVRGAAKGKEMAWFLASQTKNPFREAMSTHLLVKLTHAVAPFKPLAHTKGDMEDPPENFEDPEDPNSRAWAAPECVVDHQPASQVFELSLGSWRNEGGNGYQGRKNIGGLYGNESRNAGYSGKNEHNGKTHGVGSTSTSTEKVTRGNSVNKSGNTIDKIASTSVAKSGVRAGVQAESVKEVVKSFNRGSRFDILEEAADEEHKIEKTCVVGKKNQTADLSDITNDIGNGGTKGKNGVGRNGGKVKNNRAGYAIKEEVLEDAGVLKQLHQEVMVFKGFQIINSKHLGNVAANEDN
ncbi:hypothetical protein JRO89_XS06G0248500 [Xanthoceras sorbifolium]|uniref:Uncharacterized protein n=1 Tax=Xanthoceras sorbifolium TaxID=99658 RepID=A0ABQ8HZA9_9ROSI|nr:hypothetical protein JRO89_XS06G0248500 [Xanthoceras sorbifolium]